MMNQMVTGAHFLISTGTLSSTELCYKKRHSKDENHNCNVPLDENMAHKTTVKSHAETVHEVLTIKMEENTAYITVKDVSPKSDEVYEVVN